jgi:hypothetical protein
MAKLAVAVTPSLPGDLRSFLLAIAQMTGCNGSERIDISKRALGSNLPVVRGRDPVTWGYAHACGRRWLVSVLASDGRENAADVW